MEQLYTIPKIVSPKPLTDSYEQKIPKIIWQTMRTNKVPFFMKKYADSWIELNPEYEYRFHDDDDIIKFLETEFPQYIDGYNNLKYGASKADLWRYLIIYKFGGIYADIDCKCNNPLRNWINPNSEYVTQLGTNKDICQWLIISTPNNPIFLRAAEKTLKNSELKNTKEEYYGFDFLNNSLKIRHDASLIKINHAILGLSGPPVLQRAAEECLREGLLEKIIKNTQVVCTSGKISCQMNGNVSHDAGDEDYKKAYKSLNLKHYNSRIEKIRRKLKKVFFK